MHTGSLGASASTMCPSRRPALGQSSTPPTAAESAHARGARRAPQSRARCAPVTGDPALPSRPSFVSCPSAAPWRLQFFHVEFKGDSKSVLRKGAGLRSYRFCIFQSFGCCFLLQNFQGGETSSCGCGKSCLSQHPARVPACVDGCLIPVA